MSGDAEVPHPYQRDELIFMPTQEQRRLIEEIKADEALTSEVKEEQLRQVFLSIPSATVRHDDGSPCQICGALPEAELHVEDQP